MRRIWSIDQDNFTSPSCLIKLDKNGGSHLKGEILLTSFNFETHQGQTVVGTQLLQAKPLKTMIKRETQNSEMNDNPPGKQSKQPQTNKPLHNT